MADPKSPSLPKTGPWTDVLKPGEARCFTNRAKFKDEGDVHLFHNGVMSRWPLDSPCSHHLGPYGWVTDTLLSGYSAYRHEGEIHIYRVCQEPGDTDWKWS